MNDWKLNVYGKGQSITQKIHVELLVLFLKWPHSRVVLSLGGYMRVISCTLYPYGLNALFSLSLVILQPPKM